MLHTITDSTHSFFSHVIDDPVRPELTPDFRISKGRLVMALAEDEHLDAMVCISFHDEIPGCVADLFQTSLEPKCVVFYSIWSYSPGKGAELLITAVKEIHRQFPSVIRFVTLSPKTPLARRFHFKNGAVVFRENESTTNYEYIQSPINTE